MKKPPLLLYSCLLMAFFTFQSCSKKGSSNNVPTPAVKLSLNKTTITADGWETVTFTAKDENDIDITNSCTFSVNSTNVSGNTWWTSTAGSCSVKATKSGVSSTTQTLTATDAGVSPFSQKVIVEDYTGTWCGHCPRVGIALETYKASKTNTIVIADHGPSSDPYTFSGHSSLTATYGINSYPYAMVNRDFKWNETNSQLDAQFINRRPPLGIALQTSVSGNTINVAAKVKFNVTTDVNLNLVVYLLEDGKVYPQTNYGYYSLPNPITNYIHNGVLRKTGTDLFGDLITTSSQQKGNTYIKNLSFDATGYNLSNCKIVAFVVQGTNSQQRKEGVVINAQSVTAGQNKDFD